ncbi:MAG: helix-turn-helix transcriptional regulator [Oscillospiraceae bacterium]|jgi:transcriptional regulator with XRE-family HTH domain
MRKYKSIFKEFTKDHLKAFRTGKHLSQEQLAELLHISPRSYTNLEQGKFFFSSYSLIFLLLSMNKEEILQLLDKFRDLVEEADCNIGD